MNQSKISVKGTEQFRCLIGRSSYVWPLKSIVKTNKVNHLYPVLVSCSHSLPSFCGLSNQDPRSGARTPVQPARKLCDALLDTLCKLLNCKGPSPIQFYKVRMKKSGNITSQKWCGYGTRIPRKIIASPNLSSSYFSVSNMQWQITLSP